MYAFDLLLFLTISLAALASIELGFRIGRRRAGGDEPESLGTAVGAHLGLMAFVLAIAFGASGSRLDARRELVIKEANAIGTAELRARYLPEPHATRVRTLLRRQVEARTVRIESGELTLEQAVRESDDAMAALWTETMKVVDLDSPPPPIIALFVGAINDVIDINTERATVFLRHRIPIVIWGALGFITALGLLSVGYQAGRTGQKRTWAAPPLVFALAILLTIIIDLDVPRQGIVQVDQAPMLTVLEALEQPSKAATESSPSSENAAPATGHRPRNFDLSKVTSRR